VFDTAVHYLRYRLGLAAAETKTSPAEREALARHAAGRLKCVEIGVWHGVNTLMIRKVMDSRGVLTGVDPFEPGRLGVSFPRLIAMRETAKSSHATLRLLRMTSREAAGVFQGTVDFLFIDGDHSWDGLRTDWESWRGKIETGGVVCLHDSRATGERPIHDSGSVRYTTEVILRDAAFEVVEEVETLTVLRRK
jgi:predicted O-methyltransferase YrrM